MNCYVIILSKVFPAKHSRKGTLTLFKDRFNRGVKKHTIRKNYPLWEKRFNKINKGEAYISIREWIDKPYRSRQRHIKDLHSVRLQKLWFDGIGFFVNNEEIDITTLAHNDGLTVDDFKEWFKSLPIGIELALIHFTKLRY